MTVVDTAAATVVGGPIGVGSQPSDVETSEDGRRIFVANYDSGTVSVLDAAGAEVVRLPVAEDSEAAHRAALERALAADLVVTSGGVSVGPHDLVRRIEVELGVEEVFWGVAVKPGKPIAFGVRAGTLVFGLPGNPVSSHVSFELFARPALLQMMGHSKRFRPVTPAVAGHDMRRRVDGKLHLNRVTLRPEEGSGRLVAAFVRAVAPEVVAVSVGRNAYGHPAPSALAMFRSAGASVLRTDRLGDVVVEMDLEQVYLGDLLLGRARERVLHRLADLVHEAVGLVEERHAAEDDLGRRHRPTVLLGDRGHDDEDAVRGEHPPVAKGDVLDVAHLDPVDEDHPRLLLVAPARAALVDLEREAVSAAEDRLRLDADLLGEPAVEAQPLVVAVHRHHVARLRQVHHQLELLGVAVP